MGGLIVSEHNIISNEDLIKIREYIEKNYKPNEEYREEDELQQKLEELEEKGFPMGNRGTQMSVMTSLPPEKRVFVTINEMAKIIGIGHNSIIEIVRDNPKAKYIYWEKSRAYLKREMFIEFMLERNS